jgi:hypothetical protein
MFILKIGVSFLFSICLFLSAFGQKSVFFQQQLRNNPTSEFPVCIKNSPENIAFLSKENRTIKNENILKDELDLVKEKINKMNQLESTLEVYKDRLKEIPELK